MKTLLITLASLSLAAHAAPAGENAAKSGGRILVTENGQAEFLIQPDRKVAVTFYGKDKKPAAPGAQSVSVIAEAPSGKEKLEMEKTPNGFVSKVPLPAGEGYRLVVQIRETPGGKPQNFRIDYNMSVCGECQKAEYSCACDHSNG